MAIIDSRETIDHLRKRLEETALNNAGFNEDIYLDIADHRIETWVNEITPVQQWTPISDNPPKIGHRVLFKLCDNSVYVGVLLKLNDELKITLEPTGIGWIYSFEVVIGWMPLPE